MANPILTQNRLKELLDYNADTGEFTWRISHGPVKAGAIAGYNRADGYRRIRLDDGVYYAHRLAWLYTTGAFSAEIDHIDRDKANNRIGNLRAATKSQNMQNRPIQCNNSSGYKGVDYYKCTDKWRASIGVNGKRSHLGYFDSPEEASNAYQKAAAILHTHRPKEVDIAKTCL